MLIIGLTGSIGMGKTSVSEMFHRLGIVVWNADDSVHRLYNEDTALASHLASIFGDILDKAKKIDRQKLGKLVLADDAALKKLEAIIHPIVAKDREKFIQNAAQKQSKYVILDIPLLFENGADAHMDKTIVVDCTKELQRQRVLGRPGMSEEKLAAILAKQIPNEIKKQKADFVIDTNTNLDQTNIQVHEIHNHLMKIKEQ